MKKIFQYTMGILTVGMTMTACQPESYDGADQMGIPTVADKDFTMVVDQETNQVQVNFPETQGVYPIWSFNGASYSTLNNAGYQNNKKGTYTVSLRLGNRNGFSQGELVKEFTFNETKANFTAELNRLGGKEWRIDYAEPAHMACGPYGGDGSGWWNAQPNEKQAFGVYDDRITFQGDGVSGGTFTYNPGPDGMTYVNTGTTIWGPSDADFDTPTQEQTATFELKKGDWIDSEGNVIETNFLELSSNTLFPYISSDRQYNAPRFRIETLTASKLVLVYENAADEISWRFIFTSKAEEKAFEGFDANSQFNLWKGITPTMSFYYNPDPNWSSEQSTVLEAAFQSGDNDYSITVPDQCYGDWQAQVHFHTDLNTSAATNYDFSCILNSDKDISGVIIKLTDEADADFIFEEHVDLKAGEDYILWKSDVPGKDLSQVKLATDYGHATGETHINLRNIVLKDHANDDGTVLPGNVPGGESSSIMWVAVDSPDNLGAGFNTKGEMSFWWADGGWSQLGDPDFSYGDGIYTITATENGGAEWQGQCTISGVPLKIEKGVGYDVRVKVVASADLGRFTVKVNKDPDVTNDPNTLCYKGNFELKEGENILTFENVVAKNGDDEIEFDQAKMIFDLGGAPAGFIAEISDIIIQKHNESAAGGGLSYNDANNLWKAVDNGDAFISVTPWFADGGWSQIADPEWSHDGNTWSLTIPEGMGPSQWQGQFPINTTIATKQTDKYSFSCTILADHDLPGVTIKLTETDDANGTKHDSNFYFAERHDIKANEPYVYTVTGATLPLNDAHALSLFFDFGGSPIGSFVEISDIVLVKE